MRRGLGCARIEEWFTWLFESSWRSTSPAAAVSAAAELFAAADAEVGHSSRLESRPRPRFSREETGFECWQPRRAAIVQRHQYRQSEQLHRHLRSGRGSIYLFAGALDPQRRRQHEQVLVQSLPPCSLERTLPPHPGHTGKQPARLFLQVTECTTELSGPKPQAFPEGDSAGAVSRASDHRVCSKRANVRAMCGCATAVQRASLARSTAGLSGTVSEGRGQQGVGDPLHDLTAQPMCVHVRDGAVAGSAPVFGRAVSGE